MKIRDIINENSEEERCIVCDEPTGKAGRGDDSLYTESGKGPFCDECFPDEENEEHTPRNRKNRAGA